ncbi:MAG: DUF924 family protein [Paracoccaceae bacterium]
MASRDIVQSKDRAQDVVEFWKDVGPKGWFTGGAELDQRITARFAPLWGEARHGGLLDWTAVPDGMLAYLILTDQMPRNMFRGRADAFATDAQARAAAMRALALGHDMAIAPPLRMFFYLPFEHGETAADQHRSVGLFLTRMSDPDLLLHARAHREVIRRFGRFPDRNAALRRESSASEAAFLSQGGYARFVKAMIQTHGRS